MQIANPAARQIEGSGDHGAALWIDRALLKYRVWGLVLICGLHLFAHYFYLGFGTWDGLTYRIPPIVELLQNGSLGGWKFNYPAAQHFYPFFELLHLPFLKLFGLPGLYFSYSLLLLPASVIAIYLFVRELTGDRRWATYGALTYLAIPFVNAQAFSGYIDFAVIGALAFFLASLVRVLRSVKPSWPELALLSASIATFTLSRQQALYVAIVIIFFFAMLYQSNEDRRGHPKHDLGAATNRFRDTSLALFIGLAPAVALHVSRFLRFGSPIYPYQFRVLMFSTAIGLTPEYTMAGAGLLEPSWSGLIRSFIRGWIWPGVIPTNFYDSRVLGVGLFFWIALLLLPIYRRKLTREHSRIMVLFALIALVAKDFWLPRWSMTLILILVLCVGAALARTATAKSSWRYLALLALVGLHLARPIYDAYTMVRLHKAYYRVNLAGSVSFIGQQVASGEVVLYPDLQADLYLVHPVTNEFILPLYGSQLTNRIEGVLEPRMAAESCRSSPSGRNGRKALIVDQSDQLSTWLAGCSWECEQSWNDKCLAGRLVVKGAD